MPSPSLSLSSSPSFPPSFPPSSSRRLLLSFTLCLLCSLSTLTGTRAIPSAYGPQCSLLSPPLSPVSLYGTSSLRTLTLQARNSSGNDITSGGDLFFAALFPFVPICAPNITYPDCSVSCAPSHSPRTPSPACLSSIKGEQAPSDNAYVPLSITDLGTGQYTLLYQPEYPNDYELSVWQMIQGGLHALYYDNAWFLGTPSVDRIDETVNFNWKTGMITPYAADYVSISWTGSLVPAFTESYTLYAVADDWIRVWIDKQLIIEAWGGLCCAQTWSTVNLTANFFHDIIVEYVELRAYASVSLSWSSYSTPLEIIPFTALYSRLAIEDSPFSPVEVTPGDPASAIYTYAFDNSSLLVPQGGLSAATAGVNTAVLMQAVDVFGNLQTSYTSFPSSLAVIMTGAGSVTPTLEYLSNGTYLINYTATVAGTYSLELDISSFPIIDSPFTVVISPASAAPSTTLITGVPSTATAGITTIFCIQLRDAFNNFCDSPGTNIVLASWNNEQTFISYQSLITYVSAGLYNCSFTPTIVGVYNVNVSVANVLVGRSPYLITVNYGAASAAVSIPSGSGLTSATAGLSSTFSITARDQFGNIVSSAGLSYSYSIVNAAGSIANSGSLAYWKNGIYNATYTLTIGGMYTLTLTGPGSLAVGTSYVLTVIPGAVSISHCTVIGNLAATAVSSIPYTFQVQARDSSNNALSVDGVLFLVSLMCLGNSVTGTSSYQANGTYLLSVIPTISATCTLSITSGAVSIFGSPFTVSVVPGAAVGQTSVASGSALTSGVAGVANTITVHAYDAADNALFIGGSLFSLALSPSGPSITTTDFGNGMYSFVYTPTVSGTYSTAISVLVQNGLSGSYYTDQSFSSLYTTRIDPQVDFSWIGTAPASGMSAAYYSVSWSGQVYAPVSGTYTFYVTTNADTGVNLNVNNVALISSLNPLSGSTNRFGLTVLTGATYYPIILLLSTLSSGAAISLSWSCAWQFPQVIIPSSNLYYSDTISGSPFTTNIVPAASVASTSSYQSSVSSASLPVGISFTVSVQLRDAYSNIQTLTTEASNLTVTLSSFSGSNLGTFSSTGSGGAYSATVTPSYLGAVTLIVALNSVTIGSPSSYTAVTGMVVPAYCLPVSLSVMSPVYAGIPTSFLVQTKDVLNNSLNYDVTSASLPFSVTMTTTPPTPSATVYPVLAYASNGQYSVSYTPTVAANYSLSITLGGTSILGSPFTIWVQPGQALAVNSVLQLPLAGSIVLQSAELTLVRTYDAFGNALISGGYQFFVQLTNTSILRATMTDYGNGSYAFFYTADVAGLYSVVLSLAQGSGIGNSGAGSGLTGTYYNNRWLTAPSVLTRVDPTVNFNYGNDSSNPIAITPTARDYVSVSWTGFIWIDTAGSYNFTVTWADGARLIVDDNVLFDEFTGSAGTQSTIYTFPTSALLYSIELDYRHNLDLAYIQLNYSCSSPVISNQVIPASILYPAASSIFPSSSTPIVSVS